MTSPINEAFELPTPVAAWLEEYKRLQAEKKTLEERMEIARAHVELALGENQLGSINGVPVVKYAFSARNTFDQTKAKKLLTDEQIAECITTTQVRSFRLFDIDKDSL